MSRPIDKKHNLWKRKPHEPAEKPKPETWMSAKPANAGRILSGEERAAALAKMGIKP